jgi:hypothetical protein
MFTGRRTRAAEEATHIFFSQPAKNGKGEFSLANKPEPTAAKSQ